MSIIILIYRKIAAAEGKFAAARVWNRLSNQLKNFDEDFHQESARFCAAETLKPPCELVQFSPDASFDEIFDQTKSLLDFLSGYCQSGFAYRKGFIFYFLIRDSDIMTKNCNISKIKSSFYQMVWHSERNVVQLWRDIPNRSRKDPRRIPDSCSSARTCANDSRKWICCPQTTWVWNNCVNDNNY